ncbi:transposase [Streptomyces sp. NPDC059802]|uniref:transposase n=1 Tax=Streptomyces sp. NPDC059802 TaxID=3346952 RepID=UPI0036677FEF
MILRALASPLPVGWVTADPAYGQDTHFRRFLEDHRLSYVVAVPKPQQVHGSRIDHLIRRGLTPGPRPGGRRYGAVPRTARGSAPSRPAAPPWSPVDAPCCRLNELPLVIGDESDCRGRGAHPTPTSWI